MAPRALAVPFEGVPGGALGGLLDAPARSDPPFAALVAHGAGAGMETPLLDAVAAGLAAGGLPALRFRFPYMERATREGGRRPPDARSVLEDAYRAAHALLGSLYPGAAPLLGGKSLGGRIASLLAADGLEGAGLFFLGYPLHPPGKPGSLRTAHFPAVRLPTLFLQGTRDRLCELELLRRELPTLAGRHELVVVEGADHGFEVPKRSGLSPAEVHALLAREILRWAEGLGPAGEGT